MTDRLLPIIDRTVPQRCWPAEGAPLVIAVSGGPDSTALAFLLKELNDQTQRDWRIHLAHLNHRLRGADAEEDAEFVRSLAQQHGWGLSIDSVAVAEIARRRNSTIEETARNERYSFFVRVLTELDATIVATAHHADDNAETVLHRVLRGTGLRGLGGIPVSRSIGEPDSGLQVIRPLLRIQRSEIMAFLNQRGIAFRRDHTNEDIEHTRNRVRKELIPALERRFNPGVRAALLRLAQQITWVNDCLQPQIEAAFEDALIGDEEDAGADRMTLNTDKLLSKPVFVQTEVIRRVIRTLGIGEKRLRFDHVQSICELAAKNVSGKRLELLGCLQIVRERGRLVFTLVAGGD